MQSRLRRYVRAHGARQTAIEIGRRVRSLAYTEEQLIVLLKDLDSIVEPLRRDVVRLEDLGPQHLPQLAELNRKRCQPQADRRFARYVEQGFSGFVGYHGEELAGYYWWVDSSKAATFPDLRELGLGIAVEPKDVYGSDFYLLEEHRGAGVAADFLFKVESSIAAAGYGRIWGYVLSTNRPARWIYSTRGYLPMWIVERKRILLLWRAAREELQPKAPKETETMTRKEVAP
jgi:GNAT superfamily N-acetyltransferase